MKNLVVNKKLVCLIIALPVLIIGLFQRFWNPFFNFNGVWTTVSQHGSNNNFPRENKLIHGLLPPNLDEKSCSSRYNINSYRKPSPYIPSSSLISKLRSYENLHKRCGPSSSSYQKALQILSSSENSTDGQNTGAGDCKYVVILTRDGLGNQILALVSAFFYALITDRVLLVDRRNGLEDLFCEPFTHRTWFLPADFPLRRWFGLYRQSFPESFGNRVRNGQLKSMEKSPPSSLYLHLSHDAGDYDRLFYCDRHQSFLRSVPWLIFETNNYIVPALFLLPTFRENLSQLFPEKPTVFHHLSRYLLHPSNSVWGLIRRSYEPYLSRADKLLAVQIRVFGSESGSFDDQMTQLLACTHQNDLLPELELQSAESMAEREIQRVKVVLVTSLSSEYQEKMRSMFVEHPAINGEMVAVYQPSHERSQSSGERVHDRKALSEMFLLSFSDEIVTSSWSTFGYVAQGLGGLRPWILYKPEEKVFGAMAPWLRFRPENRTAAGKWPCRRGESPEPCFHTPPVCECGGMGKRDGGAVVGFVKHCEDASWGIKLVEG